MRKFLFLCLLCTIVFAEDDLFDIEAKKQISRSVILDPTRLGSYAPGEQEALPDFLPKVNVVTGDYIDDEQDLIVAGAEPLSVTRFYSS
ncbi:MAG: hypothetical protein KR126chlam2_00450, partial [Chlamydiae bacterium]|nr:hypothetical protein [Chlamydiota bacterium]